MLRLLVALLLPVTMFAADTPIYVGTYTKPGGSQGIYRYKLDLETGAITGGELAATSSSPSFLAMHPSGEFLYAANEAGDGSVSAFAVTEEGALKPLNQQPSRGKDPCHV